MNTLLRLPKSCFSPQRNRIVYIGEIQCVAYTVCSQQRNILFQKKSTNYSENVLSVVTVDSLNANSICYIPKRHKSITETVAGIYTSISHSDTVSYFQNTLISFHDFTGLPWWATIIIYTIGLRMVIFPIAIYGHRIRGRLHSILEHDLPAINEELKKEVAAAIKTFNWDDKTTFRQYNMALRKQKQKLIERDNCHPFKASIVFWVQIPVWVCHSIGIRNIINMVPNPNSATAIAAYTQMTVGGFLWVPNLIEADTTFILPVVLCIVNLINIELGGLETDIPKSKFHKGFTNMFRLIVIAIVPIVATVPSCLSLYWCTSSICALTQNLVLLSPTVKRTFGIATNLKQHMEHPYKTIAQRFVQQMKNRKEWCTSLIKLK